MHKNTLFSAGITVKYGYGGPSLLGWLATVHFDTSSFGEKGSIRGEISTQFADSLSYSIDTIKREAEQMGITWFSVVNFVIQEPSIHYQDDDTLKKYPPPPEWKELLRKEAERLGWDCSY